MELFSSFSVRWRRGTHCVEYLGRRKTQTRRSPTTRRSRPTAARRRTPLFSSLFFSRGRFDACVLLATPANSHHTTTRLPSSNSSSAPSSLLFFCRGCCCSLLLSFSSTIRTIQTTIQTMILRKTSSSSFYSYMLCIMIKTLMCFPRIG